jgi:hypothetical protein
MLYISMAHDQDGTYHVKQTIYHDFVAPGILQGQTYTDVTD